MATAPPSADGVLVRRLRERDRTAWEELYESYGPRLRPFAYRLTGNRHDADDLVQETFVRALPRLDRLDPDAVDIGAYPFNTLRNLFLKSNARLAPSQRLVLALRELEDRSYADIAVVVGLKENAVAQLISRARESLRT